MNVSALMELQKSAPAFARCYCALVESLRREGVPEDVARGTAITVALSACMEYEEDTPEEFPGA